jgi:hypothetical protein
MRKGRKHRTSPIERLRLAIDCLPVATREAMLAGVEGSERIIAGAYVDGKGGVCPMLAAHRRGGRTDFLSFAKSWDRFARTRGSRRVATERERRILIAQLQDSLESSTGLEFDRAIREHRALRSRRLRRGGPVLEVLDPPRGILARRIGRPARRRAQAGERRGAVEPRRDSLPTPR